MLSGDAERRDTSGCSALDDDAGWLVTPISARVSAICVGAGGCCASYAVGSLVIDPGDSSRRKPAHSSSGITENNLNSLEVHSSL